ncbi:hypothetical protein [Desertivirga brevis]|uniref:hypothetical protein n=1 Tax=Desertivirga brevis TaxID=2810310 RepID=UPI001A9699B5|nr:hypothetical protein [Pedobacter sp. SYSU D00873]
MKNKKHVMGKKETKSLRPASESLINKTYKLKSLGEPNCYVNKRIRRIMEARETFFVLTYKHLPNVDFLCDLKGNIRVKISRIKEKIVPVKTVAMIYAVSDDCLFLFEDLGCRISCWSDFEPALTWYQRFCRQSKLEVYLPE